MLFPKKLQQKLDKRKNQGTLRELGPENGKIDFFSNDYLGFAKNPEIFLNANRILSKKKLLHNGATGSRLLSGNHTLYHDTESYIEKFHKSESAILFNSGYDANIGFFGAVPQRGDFIFYDEYIHASIRDGVQMSPAKSFKFHHNDLIDLQKRIKNSASSALQNNGEVYIVTESVFSMDGDSPDLKAMVSFCQDNGYHLIVDEAHAIGVFGLKGSGLLQQLGLVEQVFARIVTFGKALGCHGAAILGSASLTDYLVNFARSLIYTTALSPHSTATILCAYTTMLHTEEINKLHNNIFFFKSEIQKYALDKIFIESDSAIQCCIIPGVRNIKKIAKLIQDQGYGVKPILNPTVPEGKERLRFCIHSFNTNKEISDVLSLLTTFVRDITVSYE